MLPFIIAVSGPTSAGKSYFTTKLIQLANKNGISVTSISTDEFYKDLSHLSMEERNHVNYDHPNSIDSQSFIQALKVIKSRKSVKIPIYDFSIHNRSKEMRKIEPVDLLIVEGIFTLAFEEIEQYYSLKIYVDMDDDIRVIRRIQRDMEVRGRSLESVIDQYLTTVKPTQNDFVRRDRSKAQIILRGDQSHDIFIELIINFVKNFQ